MLPEANHSTTMTTVHIKFVLLVSGLPLSVEAQTRAMRASTSVVFVRVSDVAFWRSPLASTCLTHNIDLCEIFECAHLKFTVSDRSIASRTHTCVHNVVTLVWGLLRLAPIKIHMKLLDKCQLLAASSWTLTTNRLCTFVTPLINYTAKPYVWLLLIFLHEVFPCSNSLT